MPLDQNVQFSNDRTQYQGDHLISVEIGNGIKSDSPPECTVFFNYQAVRGMLLENQVSYFVLLTAWRAFISSVPNFKTLNRFLSKRENHFCSFCLWYKKCLLTRMCSFLMTGHNIKETISFLLKLAMV